MAIKFRLEVAWVVPPLHAIRYVRGGSEKIVELVPLCLHTKNSVLFGVCSSIVSLCSASLDSENHYEQIAQVPQRLNPD